MKKILLLAVVCFSTITMKSQMFGGGIVGGVSTSAVRLERTGEQLNSVVKGNGIRGFETGLFARLKLGPIYVKPMGLYNFSSGTISSNSETNTTHNFTMHRIETPLLFGLKLAKPIGIEGGPVYNYIIYSNTSNSELNIAEAGGVGYRVGVALEIKRLLINGAYSGFTVNSSGRTSFKEPYKLIFGLGIKLGKLED